MNFLENSIQRNEKQLTIANDLKVNRLGFGAMRITGPGIWGEPVDPNASMALLKKAVELGINFIDTADSYGPEVHIPRDRER